MNTIKIGSQEWATEDLRVAKFRNGEAIPLVKDNDEWINMDSAAYCITPYGNYLYNWYAVNDPRGLAPQGFHVPSDDEWTQLTEFLGGKDVAGNELKTPDWDGTNSSGFSALPGGYRKASNGLFYYLGDGGGWWSSSQYFYHQWAWARYLDVENSYVYQNFYNLRNGFSVRCLKTLNTNEK